jgi:hypothetical protein
LKAEAVHLVDAAHVAARRADQKHAPQVSLKVPIAVAAAAAAALRYDVHRRHLAVQKGFSKPLQKHCHAHRRRLVLDALQH